MLAASLFRPNYQIGMPRPLLYILPLLALTFGLSCRQSEQIPATQPPQSVVKEAPKELEVLAAPAGFAEIAISSLGQRVPIIMYHDVIPERGRDSVWFDCSVEEFKAQMEMIKTQGFAPISLKDLLDHLAGGKIIPDKSIVLTFDDNYQGFYDNALPILRENKFPAAMFVHTGFVGDTKGSHPKMSWETLQELVKDPLITIGSHTVTHPDDITKLSPDDQTKELTDSKSTLETKLGIKIDFLAYPDGKNDANVQSLSRDAGYRMAFSTHNGLAEESPGILCVNRYIHTKLEAALKARDDTVAGGISLFKGDLKDGPVTFKEGEFEGIKLTMVTGGKPLTIVSETREGVVDFIKRTPGAVAGINGTFFAMAAIKATDNRLVGPCKTPNQPDVIPDIEPLRIEKIRDRPVIMWSEKTMAIFPFHPQRSNDDAAFKAFMPEVSDVFLGGVWLVHEGVAKSADELKTFGAKDIEDPRRRAFVGITMDGQIVLGASKSSIKSSQVAIAAAAAGVREAVLLDSGFSTSLVYNNKILASGHSTPTMPSRPVPHAILIKGELDPESVTLAAAAIPATIMSESGSSNPRPRRSRRHRAKKIPIASPENTDANGVQVSPPDSMPPP